MDEKKKLQSYHIILAVVSAIVIVMISFSVIKVLNSSYSVVIKDKDLNYFRAGNLFICGNKIICSRDTESVKDIQALPEVNKSRFHFSVLSMDEIISIEIIQDETDDTEQKAVQPELLGKYKIELQGYEGILFFGVCKNRIYGTVRFPKWAKGKTETLKGVRISSRGIKFTRSASSAKEMTRLGANYFFKQKFYGTWGSPGKIIKGYMINDRGEKHEWEAKRK